MLMLDTPKVPVQQTVEPENPVFHNDARLAAARAA